MSGIWREFNETSGGGAKMRESPFLVRDSGKERGSARAVQPEKPRWRAGLWGGGRVEE